MKLYVLLIFAFFTASYSFGAITMADFPFDIQGNIAIAGNPDLDALFQAEIKIRNDWVLIDKTRLDAVSKKETSLLAGYSGEGFKLRLAALAGADYAILKTVSLRDNRIVVNVRIADTLSGTTEWDDEVWTTDMADANGIKKALKDTVERLVRKMTGQSIAPYTELSETENKTVMYQVKVTLTDIAYREEGARYRVEMLPLGVIAENTNLIIEGKKTYTVLVYNVTRGQLVFSNQYFIDEARTIRLEDTKWGDMIHCDIFTGMGMGGAGLEFFLARKISAGLSFSVSYYDLGSSLGLPSYISLGGIAEANYYLIGDLSYNFRVSAGALLFLTGSVSSVFEVESGGLGLQAGVEYFIFYLKAGLVYAFQSPSTGFYPVVRLGIRLP